MLLEDNLEFRWPIAFSTVGQQDLGRCNKCNNAILITPWFSFCGHKQVFPTLGWQIKPTFQNQQLFKTQKVAQQMVYMLLEGEDLPALKQLYAGDRVSFTAHKAGQEHKNYENSNLIFVLVTTLWPATMCTYNKWIYMC